MGSATLNHHSLDASFFGKLMGIAEHLDLCFTSVVSGRQVNLESLCFQHFFTDFQQLLIIVNGLITIVLADHFLEKFVCLSRTLISILLFFFILLTEDHNEFLPLKSSKLCI